MQNNFQVLIDSDVFVGLFLPDDAHFSDVSTQFDHFETEKTKLATTNLVIAETATVLSHKDNQDTAKQFLHMIEISNIPILTVTKEIEKQAWQIFKDQSTKKTSFIDCTNIAMVNHFHIPQLYSFDRFYTKLGVSTLHATKAVTTYL